MARGDRKTMEENHGGLRWRHVERFPGIRIGGAGFRLFLFEGLPGRDGFGVYVMVEGTLLKQSSDVVVSTLEKTLKSPHRNVRYWSTYIASAFADPRLFHALLERLQENDSDMQCMAALALGSMGTTEALAALRTAKAATTDPELLEMIDAQLPESST